MGHVITMTNRKGGVGKTTSATVVGHGMAVVMRNSGFNNSRVLVVDCDSQAHSTLLLTGEKHHDVDRTLYGVLNEYRQSYTPPSDMSEFIVQSTWDEDLYVLPAHERLDEIRDAMIGMDGSIFVLRRILNSIRDQFAVIIIDTSPSYDLLTKQALFASDRYLIPVAPSTLDAEGLIELINRVEKTKKEWEQSVPMLGGVMVVKFSSRVNGHNIIRDGIAEGSLSSKYLGTVPINAALEYSQENRESVLTFINGRSAAAAAYTEIIQNLAVSLFQKA